MKYVKKLRALAVAAIFLALTAEAASFRQDNRTGQQGSSTVRSKQQVARLRSIMLPLVRVTNHRMSDEEIRVSIVDDPAINAATSGDGQYYVTTGLLNQANDEQLRGVLAHEIAHADLGHAVKAQILGTGLSMGAALLEQLFPGSGAFTPIAGTLISNNYTRPLEIEADRHAVTLLQRAGYPKRAMVDTLAWLMRRSGDGGGVLSSHPATSERIRALRSLR